MAYILIACFGVSVAHAKDPKQKRPNVILVMTDDQGWGQTGYYNHPILKTPNLDLMAQNGLRFDRFYAGSAVCSPTRATVLTGRSNSRTGVFFHGNALRHQERTISAAMKKAGYATAHFGKWHLNGLRGPGVPILAIDPYHPGHFGFDDWLSVTNFFDMDPLMGRKGTFEQFKGDSSEIIVAEALKFIKQKKNEDKPFFVVVWYGSPHSPWIANEADRKAFAKLDENSRQHYGELAAMDRSIGTLRAGLKKLGLADNTLVWFNSDNGGLPKIKPDTVGGLRGFKGSVYEGGLRVPCIIEWPAGIKPRVTNYPASTLDIAPTLVDLLGLPKDSLLDLIDGESIVPVMKNHTDAKRKTTIPFMLGGKAALIDNDYKIVMLKVSSGKYELYDLKNDPTESKNIFADKPKIATRLKNALDTFIASVKKSNTGTDYAEGKITPDDPPRIFWVDSPMYKPYLEKLNAKQNRNPNRKRRDNRNATNNR